MNDIDYCECCYDCKRCKLCECCSNCECCRHCEECQDCKHCDECSRCEKCNDCLTLHECQKCEYCKYCINCTNLKDCLLCTSLKHDDDSAPVSYYFKNMPTIISYLDEQGNERNSYAYFILENGEKINAYAVLDDINIHGFLFDYIDKKFYYNFLTYWGKRIVSFEPVNFDDEI